MQSLLGLLNSWGNILTRSARAFAAALMALFVAVALTGCLKFNIGLTVNPGDTVSGSVVVAVSKELAALAASSPDKLKTDDIFPAGPGVSSKAFDDGKFVGTQYDFSNVPLAALSEGESKMGQLHIVREGDNLVTSGVFDFTGSSETDLSANPMAEALMSSMDLKIAITYPGKVLETSGDISGTTVTWVPVYGKKTELTAVAYAPLSMAFPWLWVVGAVVIILIIVLVVFFILRARKKSENADAND